MASEGPRVGVLMTMVELYRETHPDLASELGGLWRGVLQDLLGASGELHFTPPAFTRAEVQAAVASCEEEECDLLLVLPLAYAASGAARDALRETRLPLLVVSTARDATLPAEMTGEHIMANHAVHGVQDLANVLAREGRAFALVAGHPSQAQFQRKLVRFVRAAFAARVLRRGRIGRVGAPFAEMCDFAFDREEAGEALGFKLIEIEPEELAVTAREQSDRRVSEFIAWARETFALDVHVTAEELAASARASLALEDLVEREALDAVSMNFLAVGEAGAPSMPFLGASRLMARGVGYAGEGDVLTAALVAAAARLAAPSARSDRSDGSDRSDPSNPGAATFTEMFCPDYARAQVLLSHMGECNFALAQPGVKVRLMAKDFPFAPCARPVAPVFQLRRGRATLASLTAWPAEGFRLIAACGEIVEAPEHPNLSSPYSRMSFAGELAGFLEDYSRAGGTHHLALAYGDLREELRALAALCGIGLVSL